VVAEDLVELGPARDAPPEPVGKPLVQLGPHALRRGLVRRVSHEDVREAEAVLARERAAVGLEQPLAHERLQVGGDRADALGRRELRHRPPPEDLADDGRALQHVALCGREAVEPRCEYRLDRGRHAQEVELGDDAAVTLDETVLVGEHLHHLFDEERVAAGHTAEPAARPRLQWTGEVLQQRRRLVGRERLQRDDRPRGAHLRELGPGEAADEDGRVAAPAGEVLDEVEKSRLRPLDVVEDEDDRPVARERLEEAPHRPVELVRA
jgi:hypothetical protein